MDTNHTPHDTTHTETDRARRQKDERERRQDNRREKIHFQCRPFFVGVVLDFQASVLRFIIFILILILLFLFVFFLFKLDSSRHCSSSPLFFFLVILIVILLLLFVLTPPTVLGLRCALRSRQLIGRVGQTRSRHPRNCSFTCGVSVRPSCTT